LDDILRAKKNMTKLVSSISSGEMHDVKAEKVARGKKIVESISILASAKEKECSVFQKEVMVLKSHAESGSTHACLVAAEQALDGFDKKHFHEFHGDFFKVPPEIEQVLGACIHLFAGIDPDLEVDKRGELKPQSARAYLFKNLRTPEKILVTLKEFVWLVRDSRLPPANVERARALADRWGDEDFRKRGDGVVAARFCEYLRNVILWYDQTEPKRQQLREANATLSEANGNLQEVKVVVHDLEGQLALLIKDCNVA